MQNDSGDTTALVVKGKRCGTCCLPSPSTEVRGFLDCPKRKPWEYVSPILGVACQHYVAKPAVVATTAAEETAVLLV